MLEFADELRELTFVLDTISEVTTGRNPSDHSIKTISSSDLTVYLKASLALASCLAKAIERIVGVYKQILDIKKSRSDLIKQGVPESELKSIEDHANNRMDVEIEKLSVEIVQAISPED